MADTPKLLEDKALRCEGGSLIEDGTEAEKMVAVLDHINGYQYTPEKSESFVIDMDSLSTNIHKEINVNPNSKFTKSLSKKGSLRWNDKKINKSPKVSDYNDTDISSPKGPGMLEKLTVGTNSDGASKPQGHHHITVTASNMYGAPTEGKCGIRRNSFKRHTSPSWVLDPKRILFLFATLSCVGTMLLIFFTLAIGKLNAEENSLE